MHRQPQPEGLHRARRWSSAAASRCPATAASQEIRAHIENGLGEAPGGGSYEEVDIYADFQREALKVIDPGAIKPLKVVLDGGNGMAGPMVGPILKTLPLELVETYWVPDGEFPGHEPNPLLPENREFIVRKVIETGADLGIAWDGDADRCFFFDGAGEFVPGDFLTALLAAIGAGEGPGRGHPLRRARLARGARTRSSGSAGARWSTASATRSSRPACATRAASSAARSPATTTSRPSTTRIRARFPRC